MSAIAETSETHDLLTIEEAASRCRVSRPTMYRLVAAGLVPAVRVGVSEKSPLRVPRRELEEWLFGDPREAA
jgi:excisionase family DNA binding protein